MRIEAVAATDADETRAQQLPGESLQLENTGRSTAGSAERKTLDLLTLEICHEHDVVLARQRAQQLAELVGFDRQDQTRIATSVSELARNALEYARRGTVEFLLEPASSETGKLRPMLVTRVSDDGPGIADVQSVLDGRHVSASGMGVGLRGARRLADRFHIESAAGVGTIVEVARELPRKAAIDESIVERIADALAASSPRGAFEEVREQNQELLRTLEELRVRQAEVEHLNAELAETNRGVLALYAELDDRAQELRRVSEYKTRFLSDVSHEFRTPLTSVLNMTRFLLDRVDGELSPEQERQVHIIRKSVESLNELVNDLLDLARVESGHTALRPSPFTVKELFASLRGMLRPLISSNEVSLLFEEHDDVGELHTDEQRLSQILRNLVANAIKFTPRGEIRVSAEPGDGDAVRFVVRDTGIGIAATDQERIFEDFTQVDGPVQRRSRGTGLGLPLSRKLAILLGGSVEVRSMVGQGSEFTLVVPRVLSVEVDSIPVSATRSERVRELS